MKEEWLGRYPVLRFNDAARHFRSREYARVFLHRMAKANKVRRITKGVYATTDDIFAIASNIYYPSYISFLSASYLYGFTEAIPIAVHVATPGRHKPLEVMGYRIEFVQMKEVWGYGKERRGSADVFIANVEKLMIDAFLKPEHMGNFHEIERVFANSGGIDIEKLREYLLRLGSGRVYRQVGFMLEKHKKIDIWGWMEVDRNYYHLNPFHPGKKINTKWRLRI
ncbi:MAG: hypothetical protein QXF56_05110 [Candidatus Micrarchaeia archaeon]